MNPQLPQHLQQYQAPDIGAALSANLGSAMPPHVSISDNRFTLIDAANNEIPVPTFDPKIGVYLDAAIIDVNNVMSRIYFDGAYDKSAEGKRPDCFSDNGVGPSISAGSPQAPTCAACPRSEWTKINANGNKVPWCTQKQKIALLIPGFDTLFLLAVPPNSHGPLREYVNHCKGNGTNIADIVTRMWFVSQGTLGFQPVTYIDAPTAQMRQAAYVEKRTDSLVGRNDVARPAGAIAPPQQMLMPDPRYPAGVAAPAVPMQQPETLNPYPNGIPGQGYGPNVTVQIPQAAPQPTAQQWPPQGGQPALQQQWPAQSQGTPQVQQSGPFGQAPVQNAGWPGQATQNSAPTVAPTSPSEPAPTTRRRRRTAAEMAAANGAAPGAPTPQAAPQAPFPHPGQQAQPQGQFPQSASPAALPGQLEFGIGQGQPASASPDVASALDSFFGSSK